MANWLDKLSKVADKVISTVEDVTSSTTQTYKEKGVDGLIAKSSDAISKTSKQLEETGHALSKKAQKYTQEIKESNKKIISEVEKNMGDDGISTKIAQGLAATINTTQHITEDVTRAAKRAYSKLTEDDAPEVVQPRDPNYDTLNKLPLPLILGAILEAKPQDRFGLWKLPDNTHISILKDTWYHSQTSTKGENSISLLTFHLSRLANVDYYNKEHRTLLENEAVSLLSKHFSEDNTNSQAPVAAKPIVKKVVPKKTPSKVEVSVAKPAAKKAVKTVKVVTPTVKKVVAKKVAKPKTETIVKATPKRNKP